MATAKAIANYFLSTYGKRSISPLKMQKLVYIAHGWHLALYDKSLVDDEYAEAWEYGPVFASLYHEFKYRGNLPIIDPATDVDGTIPKIPETEVRIGKLLDRIWEVYGGYTGMQLSAMCHQPGSPWSKARERSGWRRNAHFDDNAIKKHYREKLEQNRRGNG